MIHLESVMARSRAAATQRAVTVMAGLNLTPAVLSADDVPALVDEVKDLRQAVAARPIAGEALTLREAVRTELIGMGAEAMATIDAVRVLHSPVQQGRVFCAYAGEDRPDCSTCYQEDGGLAEGHLRTVCGHCTPVRSFSFDDEALWPCATVKLLEPVEESGNELRD